MELRGVKYNKLSPIERLVLYEKYTQERIAKVNGLAAIAATSAEGRQELINSCINALFPESAVSKDADIQKKMEELKDFSSKQLSLVDAGYGYKLSMKDAGEGSGETRETEEKTGEQ